jgi:hypothetical protein
MQINFVNVFVFFYKIASASSNSRFGPPQPAMSQGRKAIMKMIKKSTSRR